MGMVMVIVMVMVMVTGMIMGMGMGMGTGMSMSMFMCIWMRDVAFIYCGICGSSNNSHHSNGSSDDGCISQLPSSPMSEGVDPKGSATTGADTGVVPGACAFGAGSEKVNN